MSKFSLVWILLIHWHDVISCNPLCSWPFIPHGPLCTWSIDTASFHVVLYVPGPLTWRHSTWSSMYLIHWHGVIPRGPLCTWSVDTASFHLVLYVPCLVHFRSLSRFRSDFLEQTIWSYNCLELSELVNLGFPVRFEFEMSVEYLFSLSQNIWTILTLKMWYLFNIQI